MKTLSEAIKQNLKGNEHILITTRKKLDNLNDGKWYEMKEYATQEELFNDFTGKEKVERVWHEDGLCIVLK